MGSDYVEVPIANHPLPALVSPEDAARDPERYRRNARDYRLAHPEKAKASKDRWYAAHREANRATQRAYTAVHKREIQTRRRAYQAERLRIDTEFRLARLLRNRLYCALMGNFKAGSAVRDLGCTIPELRVWLEAKFQTGMTWENQGAWHIDHIVPLAKFDLTDREQLLQACNYTNLQPLWATDNLQKGSS